MTTNAVEALCTIMFSWYSPKKVEKKREVKHLRVEPVKESGKGGTIDVRV